MAAPDALSIKEPCDWSVAIRRLTFDDRPSTSFCASSQPDCASTAALTTINGLSPSVVSSLACDSVAGMTANSSRWPCWSRGSDCSARSASRAGDGRSDGITA